MSGIILVCLSAFLCCCDDNLEARFLLDATIAARDQLISGQCEIHVFDGSDGSRKIGEINLIFDRRVNFELIEQDLGTEFGGIRNGYLLNRDGTYFVWRPSPGWRVHVENTKPFGTGAFFDIRLVGLANYVEQFFGHESRDLLQFIIDRGHEFQVQRTDAISTVKCSSTNESQGIIFDVELSVDESKGFQPLTYIVSHGDSFYESSVTYIRNSEFWVPRTVSFKHKPPNSNLMHRTLVFSWSHVGETIPNQSFELTNIKTGRPVQIYDNRGSEPVVSGMVSPDNNSLQSFLLSSQTKKYNLWGFAGILLLVATAVQFWLPRRSGQL